MSAVPAAMDAPFEIAIEANHLTHRYQPGRGLDPVSFSFRAPGAVAITGANGSGKSTLLRILAGLLRPSGGASRLSLAGKEVPPRDRRTCIGFASPELAFYDELSVAENLRFAAESHGIDAPGRAVDRSLERVQLASSARDRAAALSSGMKQRLRLAFALLLEPPVLLLDEPGSHLDETGRSLVETIVHQHRRQGLVMIATNDVKECELAEERIELRGRGLGDPA